MHDWNLTTSRCVRFVFSTQTGDIDPVSPAAAWTLLDIGYIQACVKGRELDWETVVFSASAFCQGSTSRLPWALLAYHPLKMNNLT